MFYFGPIREAGHYFWCSDNSKKDDREIKQPWGWSVDGKLAPQNTNEVEGRALIHHKDGWTAISFWDRTVDKRMGCNSTYLTEGNFTFDQMIEMAKSKFPKRWSAMNFDVTNMTPTTAEKGRM